MPLKPTPPRPVVGPRSPPRPRPAKIPGLALPAERDDSAPASAPALDPLIVQARRDIDAGLVDTDMRATPGLDAERRARLVPGAGGKPVVVAPLNLAAQKSDFTAEGAPPPGKVATTPPVRSAVKGRRKR